MEKIDLKNLSPDELKELVIKLGQEPYRAGQIMTWLYQKGVKEIEGMTNLSLDFREKLKQVAEISFFTPREILVSKDGTRKYLFPLPGGVIESVLIPEEGYFTLCVSTQLGCRLKCRFCYTGKKGLLRNLTTAEIVNQIGGVLIDLGGRRRELKNIVFMGMGEPLDNYQNTRKALEIILHSQGFNFSHRRVTLSTAGLIPELKLLGKQSPINLAVSLNAADQNTRSFLMPISRKYPLPDLLKALKEYPLPHRKRITFEYILIAGVNDSVEDAGKLAELLRGFRCKINLIPFNEHPGADYLKRPQPETVAVFRDSLVNKGYTAIVRESRGSDILAACGQLGGDNG